MKLSVKTLKGNRFEIDAQPNDTVMAVKKQIEEIQGKDTYPCGQQLLIHQGKVLKDDTTIEDNQITENGFLVVMLTKTKTSSAAGASSTSSASTIQHTQTTTPLAPASNPVEAASPVVSQPPAVAPATSVSAPETTAVQANADPYGEAASILVAGSNLEQTIQQMLDMGGGSWDRDTVVRALRAAYNNPERAVEYLYSGIPETAEIAVPVARSPPSNSGATGQGTNDVVAAESDLAQAAVPSGGPNAAPLNLFPQGLPNLGATAGGGALDFLRNNPQFQALRTMVQANPQILQPMLQELSKQNPQLMRLIQDHQAEFLHLINEETEGDLLGQFAAEMPQSINVTPEEREAIERLEAMGFDRALVIEAFLACDKNEELAANYLLEHAGDYED